MSKPKTSEHKSKLEIRSDKLPPLQRLIILHLAKSEPQTINETVTAIEKSYKPTWSAFNSLEKKKLIGKAGVKEYRNREYPVYWLTGEGIIAAMLEGADKSLLLEESKRVFPNEEIVHCFVEVIYTNPKVVQLAHNVVKNKGTIEFADLLTVLVADATSEDVDTMKKLVVVLKKYPEMYEQAKILIRQMMEQLGQLVRD